MPDTAMSRVEFETVAAFPPGYFLENILVRQDFSLLVTVLNKGELWFVPACDGGPPVEPLRLGRFEHNVTGICEIEPDVFLFAETDFYGHTTSVLRRLDLNGWSAGEPVEAKVVFTFPPDARALNGMCLLAPGVLLVSDCFAGLIWRVDLGAGGDTARPWLAHRSMGYFPGAMKPEQPGVNGVRYAARTSYLYYTSTAKKLTMRVHVDPWRLEPDGEPDLVVAGRMYDDFCVDEENACLYVTTHRENTIDRVAMDTAKNSDFFDVVAGNPFDERLIGPSSLAWGRGPRDAGRVAYVTTDGGTASPVGGRQRPATLLRMTLTGPA